MMNKKLDNQMDSSQLLAAAIIEIRNSEIAYGKAVGYINRLRKRKGLDAYVAQR